MSELADFLERNNGLVIGDDITSHYQIIHSGTEEPWGTFPAPAHEDDLNSAISRVAVDLATGKHSLRIQAFSAKGILRAQIGMAVEGRSVAARQSGNEMISQAKALSMNVNTAATQLESMTMRLQAAEQAAADAEERARNTVSDVYKMGSLVNQMLTEKENQILDRDERMARMQNMAAITQTLTPILGQAIVIGSKFIEYKVKAWEKQWAAEAEAKAKTQPVSVVEEKAN
jgi:hypothetical protein